MQDKGVGRGWDIAGVTHDRFNRPRYLAQGEAKDIGAIHDEISRVGTIALGVRVLIERTGGLTRPALLHDDGFSTRAIGPEDEVQRRGTSGFFHDGSRSGIAEQRIGRTISRIRQSAERIPGTEQNAGGATMRTEQGSLVQAGDPAGAAHGKIISGSRLAQAETPVQKRGIIRLRMVRGLGDEDDGIDGRGIQAHLRE